MSNKAASQVFKPASWTTRPAGGHISNGTTATSTTLATTVCEVICVSGLVVLHLIAKLQAKATAASDSCVVCNVGLSWRCGCPQEFSWQFVAALSPCPFVVELEHNVLTASSCSWSDSWPVVIAVLRGAY